MPHARKISAHRNQERHDSHVRVRRSKAGGGAACSDIFLYAEVKG